MARVLPLAAALFLFLGSVWVEVRGEAPGAPVSSRTAGIEVAQAVPDKIEPEPELSFGDDVLPLLQTYCFNCHGRRDPKGGINLSRFRNEAQIVERRQLWEQVYKAVRSQHMPPRRADQPEPEERAKIVAYIESVLYRVDCDHPDPGRVTIRRLNRAEYQNTVRDLLGVTFVAAAEFPADDVGYGFDNIGDVLSLPPILMEKYLDAAEQISEMAVPTGAALAARPREIALREFRGEAGRRIRESSIGFPSNGFVRTRFTAPAEREVRILIDAAGSQAGPEPCKLEVRVDGKAAAVLEIKATPDETQAETVAVQVSAGEHELALGFINDYYRPDDPDPAQRDRNLIIKRVQIAGLEESKPVDPTVTQRLLGRKPASKAEFEACLTDALTPIMRRAFRRPVDAEERDRLVALLMRLHRVDNASYERCVQLGIQAMLISPRFLYRLELDPSPDDPQAVRTIDEHELAVRLSYFLWSSMPDDELFALADQGQLRAQLGPQVDRMLKSDKAQSLVENFAAQWLHLRLLETASPATEVYAGFDAELRKAMRTETEMFLASIIREDRSILDLIDADYTFVNGRLARHYGLAGVRGNDFVRVALPPERGGVLTMASVLTVTSNPTRTSPVKRGKWVLENLLGAPPPDPPPNVPELERQSKLTGTLRQRMEQHRADPNCAVCHEQMDALGFGLENFDGIGAWRTKDGDAEIDPSGVLPDGSTFSGPRELRAVLKGRADEFARCFSEKLLTFALGRGLEYYDKCAVDRIAQGLGSDGYRFSAVVRRIVASEPFQKRRGKKG